MKILILQVMTAEIKEYAELFLSHNSKYAIKHGYHFFICNEKSSDYTFHPSWLKIKCLEDIKPNSYDYIWLLDTDCFINDFDVRLEDIILKDPKNLIISENGENGGRKLNCGSILVKSTFVPTLIDLFYEQIKNKSKFLKMLYWEQEMINDLYERSPYHFSARPMNEINSFHGSAGTIQESLEALKQTTEHFLKVHPDYNPEKYYFLLDFLTEHHHEVYPENVSGINLYNKLIEFIRTNPNYKETLLLELKKYKKKQFIHHVMAQNSKKRFETITRVLKQNF